MNIYLFASHFVFFLMHLRVLHDNVVYKRKSLALTVKLILNQRFIAKILIDISEKIDISRSHLSSVLLHI